MIAFFAKKIGIFRKYITTFAFDLITNAHTIGC